MEIKRNVKDSIFTHLFKIPKYRRELYLELHPEETDISEEDIKLRTIENIWTNGVYNDLGLLVKDKFIVLKIASKILMVNNGIMFIGEDEKVEVFGLLTRVEKTDMAM